MNDPSTALLLALIIRILFYLVTVCIFLVIVYFVTRAAINNSRLNQKIEQMRNEISTINYKLESIQSFSNKSEDRNINSQQRDT